MILNTPSKNDLPMQSDECNATPPQKSRFAQYSNESVNKMLKAPAKKSAKGLKIHEDDTQHHEHKRHGSTNISEQSYESASEQQSKTKWLFDEESVQKLRLSIRPKKATKQFDHCDSILDDEQEKADDQFKMTAEQSNVTASLFLFRDETDSQDDSDRSSAHGEHLKFAEVSQFSACNKKESELCSGFGDNLMSLMEGKINNIQFDDLMINSNANQEQHEERID